MRAFIDSYRNSIYFILALLGTLTPVSRINAQVVSLDSVIRSIDRNNPMLQQYESAVNAKQAYSEGAKSWMAPMVGAGTFMTPYPGQSIMEGRDRGSVMISIEQTIPNPSKLNASKRYLESQTKVIEDARSVQFNMLRAEAKELYYHCIVAEEKLKVLRESQRTIELMLKLARIRYPYAQGTLSNIYTLEARQHEIQNMILMTLGEIEENNNRLRTLMNLTHDTHIMVDTSMSVTFKQQQIDTTLLQAQRSDIRQLDKAIEVMGLNQQLQRYQSRPDFKLRFDHMQPIGNMPSQFTAMAMISIPIAPWSSRMYKSEIKGMQYDIQGMRRERSALLLEAQGKLTGLSKQLVRMDQQLSNYTSKIIPALHKNYDVTMLAYEENREQLPMVLDSWEALNMAQLEYLDKREEFYGKIVQYEKELNK